jgi:hypothetical protein
VAIVRVTLAWAGFAVLAASCRGRPVQLAAGGNEFSGRQTVQRLGLEKSPGTLPKGGPNDSPVVAKTEAEEALVSTTAAATALTAAAPGAGAEAPSVGAPATSAAEGETIRVSELIGLLTKKRGLQTLTPEDLSSSALAGLVRGLREKTRDEETRTFEGSHEDGFVRIVTAMFAPNASGHWNLRSVSIRIHPANFTATFDEVRRAATLALKRPKWMDLSERGTTAWSLGDRWMLTATGLENGDIALRAGASP